MSKQPTRQTNPDNTLELVRKIVVALSDKKADELAILHVTQSDITDYLVLATGNSEPHLRALRIETERILDDVKSPIAGMEQGGYGSGWTVVDAYQIMVHLFTPEQREHYALDKLWKDAAHIDVETLVNPPKPKPAKAKTTKVKKPAAPSKPTRAKPVAKAKPAAKAKAPAKPAAKKAPAKPKAKSKKA
ncbi:ribosome silencing factor [Opitutaceae bacterium TAV4]|nr:ribosome silencing factor [Opitutaceae bacterium TAV4]RRJ99206.1 ribosome silencing factor [Opitutaceae bacterium TAV3]